MSNAVELAHDAKLVGEAEAVGIDAGREIEIHLRNCIEKRMRELAWREQNRDAVAQWNEWIEKNGLPFENLRPL